MLVYAALLRKLCGIRRDDGAPGDGWRWFVKKCMIEKSRFLWGKNRLNTDSAVSPKISWKFPGAFWIANGVELLERASFYAVFITFTLYLSNTVGFNDIQAAWLGGFYSAGVYFMPPFTGAFADKMGFRRAMLLAFGNACRRFLFARGNARIKRQWFRRSCCLSLAAHSSRG